jgi:hypothetical protein
MLDTVQFFVPVPDYFSLFFGPVPDTVYHFCDSTWLLFNIFMPVPY